MWTTKLAVLVPELPSSGVTSSIVIDAAKAAAGATVPSATSAPATASRRPTAPRAFTAYLNRASCPKFRPSTAAVVGQAVVAGAGDRELGRDGLAQDADRLAPAFVEVAGADGACELALRGPDVVRGLAEQPGQAGVLLGGGRLPRRRLPRQDRRRVGRDQHSEPQL